MVALIRPSTDEIQLSNSYVQFQVPEAARLSNGDYVKVWSAVGVDPNGLGVAAQLFNHDGTAKSAPFVVNTFNSGDQTSAHVATLASGDFVVAWYGGPPVHTAAAQLYHADGTRIGGEISLGSIPFNDGIGGVVALTGGGFAVVNASAGNIVATVLDANGAIVKTVIADSGADDSGPGIIARTDGGFSLFWTGQIAVLSDPLVGVVGQTFDATGSPEGSPFLVNTTTEGTQAFVDAAALAGGGFVVTWTDNSAAGGARAQLFDSGGAKIGGEIIVNGLEPRSQHGGAVEALPWGGFVIGWEDSSKTGVVGDPGLRAQLFDVDGSKMGDEINLNSSNHPDHRLSLAVVSDNDLLAFWDDSGATGVLGGGVERHFVLPTVGSADADIFLGTVGSDVFATRAGNDTLIGGGGADTLVGGAGLDTVDYSSSPGGVAVNLATQVANGGDAQGDVVSGIENVRGSAFDDVLTGDGAANRLEGLAGNDLLVGSVNADTMDGGDGNDTVSYAGSANRVIVDLASSLVQTGGDAQGDVLISIENLVGSANDDTLAGNAEVNRLTGGGGNDVFRNTTAGFNGDTITDYSAGDTIRLTDANLAGFAFALTGSTLTYTGGSLTLQGQNGTPAGFHWVIAAAAGGGVDLTLTMDAPPLFNNTLTGDYNGDGKDDLLWRSDAGQLSNWLGQANGGFAGNDANAFAMVDPSWKVVGAGDFDGDGRDDIVWRNANTGQVSDWLGQANGGFVGNDANAFALVDVSWKIVGTGDFNGDGKDDLLWRNENTGQLSDWLGNASGNGGFTGNDANAFTQVGTDWKIVGFADFNGDGKDDLLWRNASTGALSDWLGNASGNGGFTGNDAKAFAMVDKAWHVIGTGDFNGDGREDILWRSDTGQLSNWLGKPDGGFAGNDANAFRQVGLDWQVAGVGDYDGDKRDDILWRNTTTGALSDWLGQANGGFAGNDGNALVTGVSLTWHNPVFDSFAV